MSTSRSSKPKAPHTPREFWLSRDKGATYVKVWTKEPRLAEQDVMGKNEWGGDCVAAPAGHYYLARRDRTPTGHSHDDSLCSAGLRAVTGLAVRRGEKVKVRLEVVAA